MGDLLGDIGRAFATPQYYLTLLFGLALVGYGVYSLIRGPSPTPGQPEPSRGSYDLTNLGVIALGIFAIVIGRASRNLIRTSNSYARLVGFGDLFRLFK